MYHLLYFFSRAVCETTRNIKSFQTHDLGLQVTQERQTSYFQILGIRCKATTLSAKRGTHRVSQRKSTCGLRDFRLSERRHSSLLGCGAVSCRRFEGTYCCYLQGQVACFFAITHPPTVSFRRSFESSESCVFH